MSFAPRDTHEAQVWFALERGVPAMIGILGSQRLPYPARAFDMAHCSRCLIPWFNYSMQFDSNSAMRMIMKIIDGNTNQYSISLCIDGLYLMEVDRILRPGGYWVLSGPPIHWKKYWRGWERTQEDLKQEQDSIEDVAKRLCWTKVTEQGDFAVWRKPLNHIQCAETKASNSEPSMCKADNTADAAWYVHFQIISSLIRIYRGRKNIKNFDILYLLY